MPNTRQVQQELVITELGQIGTQFDALLAPDVGRQLLQLPQAMPTSAPRSGHRKLGVEHVGSLMTRGVLIDVAGLKGVDMLPTSYDITPDDLQQALARQKLTLQPGDAVVIRTGWSKLMGKENQRYGTVPTPASALRPANGWSRRTRC